MRSPSLHAAGWQKRCNSSRHKKGGFATLPPEERLITRWDKLQTETAK
jgi:hypothetical protein